VTCAATSAGPRTVDGGGVPGIRFGWIAPDR